MRRTSVTDSSSVFPPAPSGVLGDALVATLRTRVLAPIVELRDELRTRRTPAPRATVAARLQRAATDARALLTEIYPRPVHPRPGAPYGRRRSRRGARATHDAARRALSANLHDDVLQPMLVAGQELLDSTIGDAEAVTRAIEALDEAQRALRRLIGDVDVDAEPTPAPMGLHAALVQATTRRGPATHITVAPESETFHDDLVVQIVREAYANAARHAGATRVSIVVARETSRIVLDVHDNGQGIDPAQVRDAVRRGHIGLATVTERVAGVGGNFRLRNHPDGGAHLRVVLPLTPADPSGEHPVTVVLADDHPRYRRTLAQAIGRCPPLRVAAELSDGDQALQAILRLKPDVALLDLRMPQLDGIDVVRQVRERLGDALCAPQLIVMTADPSEALRDELHAAGGDLLLDKASSRAEVCAALLAAVHPSEICFA